MQISDAKKFIGKICTVHWLDRSGRQLEAISKIHDVTYVPMYGGYVIIDTEDVRIDRLVLLALYVEGMELSIAA